MWWGEGGLHSGLWLKPQNRNRQNRIIGIGIGDFDYSIMRSNCRLIIDKKMFVPRETQEWQGPAAPSSLKITLELVIFGNHRSQTVLVFLTMLDE